MNRKKIRDHRRVARRFRLTVSDGEVEMGSTTWPLLRKNRDGKQQYNRFVHVSAVIVRIKGQMVRVLSKQAMEQRKREVLSRA